MGHQCFSLSCFVDTYPTPPPRNPLRPYRGRKGGTESTTTLPSKGPLRRQSPHQPLRDPDGMPDQRRKGDGVSTLTVPFVYKTLFHLWGPPKVGSSPSLFCQCTTWFLSKRGFGSKRVGHTLSTSLNLFVPNTYPGYSVQCLTFFPELLRRPRRGRVMY